MADFDDRFVRVREMSWRIELCKYVIIGDTETGWCDALVRCCYVLRHDAVIVSLSHMHEEDVVGLASGLEMCNGELMVAVESV